MKLAFSGKLCNLSWRPDIERVFSRRRDNVMRDQLIGSVNRNADINSLCNVRTTPRVHRIRTRARCNIDTMYHDRPEVSVVPSSRGQPAAKLALLPTGDSDVVETRASPRTKLAVARKRFYVRFRQRQVPSYDHIM